MQDYNTIIGTIEFRVQGLPYSIIEQRFKIGSGTAQRIMKLYSSFGFTADELKAKGPTAVEDLFYPKDQMRRKDAPMPDFEECHRRMSIAGSRTNLTFLWIDYKKEHPDGYQLTQFTEYYNRYVKENYGDDDVTMAVERVPGEKMYIDWVGDQPELLVDSMTGEIRKIHVFTTTLGYSSLVFAECFTDEKLDKFIKGVVDAIEYYGGVTTYFIPDNLRAAITRHDRDILSINALFKDLESFYGTIVLPPPALKPRGKASVEAHVSYLETHLVEKLKESTYHSIDEINRAAMIIIDELNGRTHKRKASRRELFERFDKPSLKPLGGSRFSPCNYKVVTSIPDNYHIEYDDHYYSVSYTLHGKPAILKATFDRIIICDEYNRVLTEHRRAYATFPRYITKDEHMPKEHLYYKTVNSRNGSFYRSWAMKFGENMNTFIDLLLRSRDHEEQAYNSCMGILQTCEKQSRILVDEAASLCLRCNTVYYTGFMRALQKVGNEDSVSSNDDSDEVVNIKHSNLRGKESYR